VEGSIREARHRPEPVRRGWKVVLAAAAVTISTSAGAHLAAQPSGFAPLPEPIEVDEARAELGRMLFFDRRLSGDTANSCASCHQPERGFADGQALSDGYTGTAYFRNSPSLLNVAYRELLMWDARLDGADPATAVRDMITEAHTMNADSRIVQERLKQVPDYVAMFEAAFGPGDPYGGKIYAAVAEFLKTLRTTNAAFDRYLRGDEEALDDEQQHGMELFAGKAGCIACHGGPLLSDHRLHATGVPDHVEIRANVERQITMLRHYATMGVPDFMNLREDVGHHVVTKEAQDIGRFLSPSLWDVGRTGPYMHSGVFDSLEEVVAFYNRGGGAHPNKSDVLRPLGLTATEQRALVAFLGSLTGDAPDITAPALPDYAPRELGVN